MFTELMLLWDKQLLDKMGAVTADTSWENTMNTD